MAQADYEKFQRFHRATFDNALSQQQDIEALTGEVIRLRSQVARSIACQLRNT